MQSISPNQSKNWTLCRLVWMLLLAVLAKNAGAQNPSRQEQSRTFASIASLGSMSGSSREFLSYNGRYAQAPAAVPMPVHCVVDAANRLQGKPYVWGGGHKFLNDRGYDCSGSVSYVLHQAGLLRAPLQSGEFLQYGDPGPGRYITVFMKNGHVFMSVLGLRFDTSDMGSGRGDGPRWRPTARRFSGYATRHPPGL